MIALLKSFVSLSRSGSAWLAILSCVSAAALDAPLVRGRTVLNLDGEWQVAEGARDRIPSKFDHVVPVPGLVDQARPAFVGVGETNDLREAFWYRRTFTLAGDVPPVAQLKIQKAAYSAQVFVNGRLIVDRKKGVTIPAPALRHGPRGDFVWVLRPDSTVEKPILFSR